MASNDVGDGPASAEATGTPAEPESEPSSEEDSAGPDTPANFTGEAVYHRRVVLEWDDVADANSYEVQFYDRDSRELVILPFGDVSVAFDGSNEVVDNLTGTSFWWLRVQAVSPVGESEWTQMLQILPSKADDWEKEELNSPATGDPTISGTTQVDETLTADISPIADGDGLDNVTFTYQWMADDTNIQGATNSTYTLADSDEGKAIKVKVSFTDDAGNDETLTSAATAAVVTAAVVTAPPLTASLQNAPATYDGQSDFTFELRFSEEPKSDFSYNTLRDHAFIVTGGTVTKSRRSEQGSDLR